MLKHRRISPKKMVPLLDEVRGKNVEDAMHMLSVLNKKSATFTMKALKAAVASYRDKGGELSDDQLFVRVAKVDRGPIWKRVRPMYRGMATVILKRTCHVTIEVGPKEVQ
ncbi:MAG: 50S ribosomal protein L22 [Candidatus Hydrothermia bacterium]|nr:50S ribosomal protein L22 [Candidatus Hydrothermia bacterium]